jgi:hypothetical protein
MVTSLWVICHLVGFILGLRSTSAHWFSNAQPELRYEGYSSWFTWILDCLLSHRRSELRPSLDIVQVQIPLNRFSCIFPAKLNSEIIPTQVCAAESSHFWNNVPGEIYPLQVSTRLCFHLLESCLLRVCLRLAIVGPHFCESLFKNLRIRTFTCHNCFGCRDGRTVTCNWWNSRDSQGSPWHGDMEMRWLSTE